MSNPVGSLTPAIADNSSNNRVLKLRAQYWIVTQNEKIDTKLPYNSEEMKYMATWTEHAPETGHLHRHYYICFKAAKNGSALRKKCIREMQIACNVQLPRAKDKKSRNEYMTKDPAHGIIEQFGDVDCEPGERNDLKELRAAISSGMTQKALVEHFPLECLHYPSGIKFMIAALEQPPMPARKRIWIYGNAGLGKTHSFYDPNPEVCFVMNPKSGWWNGYHGQPTLILDDLRQNGAIDREELLHILEDHGTYRANTKFGGMEPLRSQTIVLTSCLGPLECYPSSVTNDNIQLLRRIDKIYHVVSEVWCGWEEATWFIEK